MQPSYRWNGEAESSWGRVFWKPRARRQPDRSGWNDLTNLIIRVWCSRMFSMSVQVIFIRYKAFKRLRHLPRSRASEDCESRVKLTTLGPATRIRFCGRPSKFLFFLQHLLELNLAENPGWVNARKPRVFWQSCDQATRLFTMFESQFSMHF